MRKERHENDPRNHPRYKKRGPERFFTYTDIALYAQVNINTVYYHADIGKLNMKSFSDVIAYCLEHRKLYEEKIRRIKEAKETKK